MKDEIVQGGRGLRVAVTGAGGFIGRAVVDRIERGALRAQGSVVVLRLNDVQPFDGRDAQVVPGSCAEPAVREQLVSGGLDVLFHLASLPGGAAERDPGRGRAVNLDATLALMDAVAAAASGSAPPLVVYTSSIAALGRPTQPVDDTTALQPVGSYGTHKAMVELYLADLTRRGLIDGRGVRPAGIVARPRRSYDGFATAWMSDLFHAALERRDIVVPARAAAQLWLQSVDQVADNIVHAALMPGSALSMRRVWTLPATVTRIDALVDALSRRSGHALRVDHGNGGADQPPLDASAALALGFRSDGDADALVAVVLSRLEHDADADAASATR